MLSGLEVHGAKAECTHFCLEATGPYREPVVVTVAAAVWKVRVVNPARVKGFAQSERSRNKTDQVDAALLARFGAALQPDAWTPPRPEWRELRAWVDRLDTLKAMHQQESNRLEAHPINDEPALMASVKNHLAWLVQEIAVSDGTCNSRRYLTPMLCDVVEDRG